MEEKAKLNLYQRIAAVMSDVRYLQKDDTVGSGNYGYKAISIEKVVESVRTSLIEHGLVILPVEQVHYMEDKQRSNNKGETVIVPITTVDAKYKIVNIDKPEEFEILTSSGTGVDPQDKGVGKAMTYSYKNMIIRTFCIPTGDDTDKTHNKDLEAQQNKTASKAPAKQVNAQEAPHPTLMEVLKQIAAAKTPEEVKVIYSNHPQFHSQPTFKKEATEKGLSLKVNQEANAS